MAVRSSVMLLASAAMAVSRVAAYAVVDIDALADLAVAADIAAPLSLANRSDVAYYAKSCAIPDGTDDIVNFGTPAQAQYVQLDTGSFELWINPTCSGLSTSDETFCEAVGNFDTSASSTFNSLNTGKTLRYGIGSANITYAMDDISLPGTSTVLSQVQFGVATSSVDEFSGILGIGYGLNLTTRYPNFIDELFDQGVTKVKAFSLALGSKSEQEGVIVFGGVDTSKFSGTLARLPITPARFSPDGVPRYWVNMTSMSLTTSSTSTTTYANSSIQVFLDSGSTLTLLPANLVTAIAADFNAVGPTSNGFYTVDCSLADADGTLNFAFAGVTIAVEFRELIRQSGSQCMLGLQASSSFALLGDTFMRSAYVVIDQTDDVVWMAPYTNCGSTPAALVTAASLSTLTGACSQTGNADTSSDSDSTSTSSSAVSSSAASTAASSKSAATATTTTASATTSPAAAAGTTSATTTSSAPRTSTALSRTFTLASSLFYAAVYCFWL
ncbi:eukaryotic aspartyl protease [Ophiostoma piceae UAMH 11346]|uniref:Eukaryotic aspartyl protease n=1 Tax=Ophiostoma piceae (strain UAMH 11346) TaxID=1262450 RepID=S3C1G3_OPHP1|nr:eukaryotic aspartyl protease [Ophiostoma piceae UAMH 11346]